MAFSSDLAKLVADQLSRFVTLTRHQLAGQAANLDFWLAQVRHALAGLDEYGVRFVRMHAAQEQYANRHGVVEFDVVADAPAKRWSAPPRRVPDREIQKARRALLDATSRFLDRCRQDGLLTDAQLTTVWADLGVG